jgi:hypothetical protein
MQTARTAVKRARTVMAVDTARHLIVALGGGTIRACLTRQPPHHGLDRTSPRHVRASGRLSGALADALLGDPDHPAVAADQELGAAAVDAGGVRGRGQPAAADLDVDGNGPAVCSGTSLRRHGDPTSPCLIVQRSSASRSYEPPIAKPWVLGGSQFRASGVQSARQYPEQGRRARVKFGGVRHAAVGGLLIAAMATGSVAVASSDDSSGDGTTSFSVRLTGFEEDRPRCRPQARAGSGSRSTTVRRRSATG